MVNFFFDSPEYEMRKRRGTFTPATFAMKELHAAVPRQLFRKSTIKSLYYVFRHIAVTYMFYRLALLITPWAMLLENRHHPLFPLFCQLLRPVLWITYWGWQGVAFAGLWCLGHEAGHDALSSHCFVNASIGIVLHTFVLTPYYSWRVTHQSHHKATNHLQRDETYMPPTRDDLNLPGKMGESSRAMIKEVLEETPAYTLFKMFVRQFFGFQLYLLHNRKGNPKYPARTSHYLPSSKLFKPEHRNSILLSNTAILMMMFALGTYCVREGSSSLWAHYLMPWLFAHNWIVMFTYLQHSDPTVPYYREGQWTFVRGALSTVDRPLFGWVGRFFFHNISTDHVAHHFFSSVPFYNLPQVTNAIKPLLGDHYNYDSTPAIYALWRSFTQCTFVENEGDIVFFKNQRGESIMDLRP